MPKAHPIQSNFNTGEISPFMFGRVDAQRYKSALALCENYVPLIQGGLTRRPGTRYVAEVKDSTKSTRLIDFEFSTVQAYMIEMGDLYFRFNRNNFQILEANKIITGATQADPVVVTSVAHGFSNGDEVFITGVLGMTELNGRNFQVASVTANTFELKTLNGTDLDGTGFGAYTSDGTAGKVFEITSTYAEADLFQIKYAQSADVLFFAHPIYKPRKLTRTDHTAWTLSEIDFQDGPYLPTNITDTTLALSGTTGTVTVTASATEGINGGDGFKSTDVGRLIRFEDPAGNFTWLKITVFTSTTSVDATIEGPDASAGTATKEWRLGVWSDTTGWPAAVTFHENRLSYGGPTDNPQRYDLSNSGDFENFAPTDPDGTITDAHSISDVIAAEKVNAIFWLRSSSKGLQLGTAGGPWLTSPSADGEALTNANVTSKKQSSKKCANIQPVESGRNTIYIQRSGFKVRELGFFLESDGLEASDLTLLSDHMGGLSGFTEMAFQDEPQPIVWFVRGDGELVGMTYERDVETLKVGWHRHIFGGRSDLAGTKAQVESVGVIPTMTGDSEELWVIVKRFIDGEVRRYIEYFTPFFDDTIKQRDAFHVDSGVSFDNPKVISGITAANPPVVTSTAHGFADQDFIRIVDVAGMIEVNDKIFKVNNKTANTFELQDSNDDDIDGSGFSAYISGGQVRKQITTLTPLWRLEGEILAVYGDGGEQPKKTVTNGIITLARKAATVQLGLTMESKAQMLRIEAGAADGVALEKIRRINFVAFLLNRIMGIQFGTDFDGEMDELIIRDGDIDAPPIPVLFTGIKGEHIEADSDTENQIAWQQLGPSPGAILAVMPTQTTQDRG